MFSPLVYLLVPGLRMGAGNVKSRDFGPGDGEGQARYRYLNELARRREEAEQEDLAAIMTCLVLAGMFD